MPSSASLGLYGINPSISLLRIPAKCPKFIIFPEGSKEVFTYSLKSFIASTPSLSWVTANTPYNSLSRLSYSARTPSA